MLEKYYSQMINDTSDRISEISKLLMDVAENKITDTSLLSELQNALIGFGEKIEKEYFLENSTIIHTLERVAEVLFLISEQGSTELFSELTSLADNLMNSMKASKIISHSRMSLVVIVKNEARYMTEWIEFHNMLGVDHFYIYDNDSDDGLELLLKKYIDTGLVTYHFYPGKIVQLSVYNHAISHYKYDTEYMGFTDADEFLFPIEGYSIPDTLDKIFYDYEHHFAHSNIAGGVGVNWRSYGTSGNKKYIEGLVIENYKKRGFDDYPQNVHIKSIVKPTLVKGFLYNPHAVTYKAPEYFTISEHGSMIPSAFFFDGHCDLLRINHYYTKSEEELYYKMKVRGWPNISDDMKKEYEKSFEERLVSCNDIEDDIMDRFIEPLKRRMHER